MAFLLDLGGVRDQDSDFLRGGVLAFVLISSLKVLTSNAESVELDFFTIGAGEVMSGLVSLSVKSSLGVLLLVALVVLLAEGVAVLASALS